MNSFIKTIYNSSTLNSFFLKKSLFYPIKTRISNIDVPSRYHQILKNKSNVFFNIELIHCINKKKPIRDMLFDEYTLGLYDFFSMYRLASKKLHIKTNTNILYNKKKSTNTFSIASTLLNEYYISSKF
jgi:hypothetical protein